MAVKVNGSPFGSSMKSVRSIGAMVSPSLFSGDGIGVTTSGWSGLSPSTSIVMVAVSIPPSPSETVYSNVTGPVTPVFGVKVSVPSGLIVTMPSVGCTTSMISSASPSGSTSLTNGLIVTGVLSGVVVASSSAVGAGFSTIQSIVTDVWLPFGSTAVTVTS